MNLPRRRHDEVSTSRVPSVSRSTPVSQKSFPSINQFYQSSTSSCPCSMLGTKDKQDRQAHMNKMRKILINRSGRAGESEAENCWGRAQTIPEMTTTEWTNINHATSLSAIAVDVVLPTFPMHAQRVCAWERRGREKREKRKKGVGGGGRTRKEERGKRNIPKAGVEIQAGVNGPAGGLERHGAALVAVEALEGEVLALLEHAMVRLGLGAASEASAEAGDGSSNGNGELHLACWMD